MFCRGHHRRLHPGDIGDQSLRLDVHQFRFDRHRRSGQDDEVGAGDRVGQIGGCVIDRPDTECAPQRLRIRIPADHRPAGLAQADPDGRTDEPGSEQRRRYSPG